jgi:adenosylhomocysteine nucleosidase
MANWARSRGPTDRPIILAGLAGALRPDRVVGRAYVMTEVRREAAEPDRSLWPTFPQCRGEESGSVGCIVTSAARIARTKQEKESLARRSGADVVDLESFAFAMAASSLGWRWGIVRGISDGPATDLPVGIEAWIDARGHLRPGAVVAALCRRPGMVPALRRLRCGGRSAMRAVAAQISAWLE